MFLENSWCKMLPTYLKPPKNKLKELETIRKNYKLTHFDFSLEIGSSRWATIKTQEKTLEQLRIQFPLATEKKLWGAVILSKLEAMRGAPSPIGPSSYEIAKLKAWIDEIMKDISSWDGVINFILNVSKATFNISVVQSEINKILERKN